MPPSAATQRLITQFVHITGSNDKIAATLLKQHGNKLDEAVDGYFARYGNSAAESAASSKLDKNLGALFEQYRDSQDDDKDAIGGAGTAAYLGALGCSMEDSSPAVVFDIVKSPGVGELTREAFVKGWRDAAQAGAKNIDTLKGQQAYFKTQKALMATDTTVFRRIYRNAFISFKEAAAKAIAKEDAMAYWRVLFDAAIPGQAWQTRTTDWLALWTEFLELKYSKSVNKDLWNQVFEFAQRTMEDETLGWWQAETSAWPGVIDEFVLWVRDRRARGGDAMETD